MKLRSVLRGLLVIGSVWTFSIWLGCGPTYPECDNDENCADHSEYCVDSLCRQCRDDSHCSGSDACKICGPGYSCVTRAGCCHSDLDCPRGVCRKPAGAEVGQCFGNCKDGSQCPRGQICVNNQCVPGCTDSSQCGPDEECVDGQCVGKCRAEAIHFDYDEDKIRMDAKPVLERNAECIRRRAQTVKIEGHCDERGSDQYNMALGTKRAHAAKRYLERLGIATDTIRTMSWGEERPVCGGHTEDCWWRNRRAEFLFER